MIKRSGLCFLLATLVSPDQVSAPLSSQSQSIQQHQPQRSAPPTLKAQAEAYRELGQSAWKQRDLQGALNSYETSLDLWQRYGAGIPQHAKTLVELGEVLLEIGREDAALEIFKRAGDLLGTQEERLDTKEDRDTRFLVFLGAGLAYVDRGNGRFGLAFYEKALRVANESWEKAVAFHRIGSAFHLLENYPDAEEALDKSLELARQAAREAEREAKEASKRADKEAEKTAATKATDAALFEGYALAERAHVYDLTNREAQALAGFEQARRIFQQRNRPLYVASTLLGTAEVQRDLGNIEGAIQSINRSIELMEQVRSTLESQGNRIGFFAARHRYYAYRIQLLMEQARLQPGAGYAVKAFEQSERSKARSQYDDMAGVPVPKGLALGEIQSELLDKDTLLLSYSLGEEESFLWVVGHDWILVYRLPGQGVLEEAALKTWSNLSEGDRDPLLGKTRLLANMLLPKEIGLIPGKRLLVSPDGLLHLIPFSLLEREKNKILLEDHVITQIPSASVLVGMRRKLASRRPAPKDFAGLGDAVFNLEDVGLKASSDSIAPEGRGLQELIGPLPRLEHSRDEILNVTKLFPKGAEIFTALGFQANRNTLLDDDLAQFRMLHLATHHLAEGHPAFTGIVLSRFDEEGHPRPGFVTAQEIYDLNLPAELVVLSACGTGLGKNVKGEGPVGLTRAFLHAGAKRVVVSLWSVKDKETAVLMKRFYEQMLKAGKSPAEALREAQLSIYKQGRRGRSTYRTWGAFVLQGEPR